VNHSDAHIPAPSNDLITELAHGIHCAVAGMATADMREEHEPFDALPSNVQQYWIEGARTAYAIIAVHGGGQVETIPDAK
jgi:hypothetical protein